MASRRMLWKKISLCEKLADLSDLAALAFTWGIPHACDWGTLSGNFRVFRGIVFPLREELSIEQVESAICELVLAGLMTMYEVEGERVLYYTGWEEHQSIHKRTTKSRPVLPDDTEATECFPRLSGKAQETAGLSEPREGKRREEKSREGKGEDVLGDDPHSPHPDPFRDLWNAITERLQPGAGANRNIRPLPKDCPKEEAVEIRTRWLAVEAQAGREILLGWVVDAQTQMTGRVFTGMGHLSYCESQVQLDGARVGSEEMTEAAEAEQEASDKAAEMWRAEQMKNVVEILPDEEQDHGSGPPL